MNSSYASDGFEYDTKVKVTECFSILVKEVNDVFDRILKTVLWAAESIENICREQKLVNTNNNYDKIAINKLQNRVRQ